MTQTPGQLLMWIKVERPTFDLVGVVLSSFELTGMLALVAVALGGIFGGVLIALRRRPRALPADISLNLDAPA